MPTFISRGFEPVKLFNSVMRTVLVVSHKVYPCLASHCKPSVILLEQEYCRDPLLILLYLKCC